MKYLAIIAAGLLAACSPAGQSQAARDPSSAETLIVGKHEDCTIYYTRTLGSAPNVTWVRCKKEPKVVETQTQESCGKGCTKTILTRTTDEEPDK